jgi:hypothetical protein
MSWIESYWDNLNPYEPPYHYPEDDEEELDYSDDELYDE